MHISNKGTVYSNLNAEGKKYIAIQKSKSNQDWADFDVNQVTPNDTDITETNECFSISIPFEIIRKKKEAPCMEYFTINSPRGSITSYMNTVEEKSLAEDSGVQMRRVKKDTYVESSVTANGGDYLIFTNKDKNEKTALLLKGNQLFVISMSANLDDEVEKKFVEMLRAVRFNE
jgi:hypothetical protein